MSWLQTLNTNFFKARTQAYVRTEPGWQRNCNRGPRGAVMSWLQTLNTNFFKAGTQDYVRMWYTCLNVDSDNVGIRRVTSVAHVRCAHRSKIKVLGITVSITRFIKMTVYYVFFCIPHIYVYYDNDLCYVVLTSCS
jgi:hypothetical protein